ncbi:hypothetical protein D1872_81570 [compost metagenome]
MIYRVIKDIPHGYEVGAEVGDILVRKNWAGKPSLFKGDKVVCYGYGAIAKMHCEPIDTYTMYLEGTPYGKGNLDYMRVLFTDYVVDNEMYGKGEVTIKIVLNEKRRLEPGDKVVITDAMDRSYIGRESVITKISKDIYIYSARLKDIPGDWPLSSLRLVEEE